MAHANTSNTPIHAMKSFNKKPNPTSSKRPKNKCSKCGRFHDIGKCPAKEKHALYAKNQSTLQKAAMKDRRQSYHQSSSFPGT